MKDTPQTRLRAWIGRWQQMRLAPPPGLADDMRDAADVLDRVDAATADLSRAAAEGPQAATQPPWGWGDKREDCAR